MKTTHILAASILILSCALFSASCLQDSTAAPEAEVRKTYRLDDGRPVVLNVATKRPHKNQELLLRALLHLGATRRQLGRVIGHAA